MTYSSPSPKTDRRRFIKIIPVSVLAAIGIFKSAKAGDYCHYGTQTIPVSSCQSKTRWVRVCNGVIVGYGRWGLISRNNCEYYGKSPRCCG